MCLWTYEGRSLFIPLSGQRMSQNTPSVQWNHNRYRGSIQVEGSIYLRRCSALYEGVEDQVGITEQRRDLARIVMDLFKARSKTVSALMREAMGVLTKLRMEQEQMIEELKDILAKGESLRRKDFDLMMEAIRFERREKEKSAAVMLERFREEEERNVEDLRNIVARDGHSGPWDLKSLKALVEDILSRQREWEREVSEKLRDFHIEQEELSAGLRKLLMKGETVRIKDFKAMLKGIQAWHTHRGSEVGKILQDVGKVYEEVGAQWEEVMASAKAKEGLTAFPPTHSKSGIS